jgi:hypothetical protein
MFKFKNEDRRSWAGAREAAAGPPRSRDVSTSEGDPPDQSARRQSADEFPIDG